MTMVREFTLMEMFPWFGKLSAAADVEKYGYESSGDRLASVTLDIVTNLKEVYGQTYSVEKSIQYLEYKRRLLQSVVRVAEQLEGVLVPTPIGPQVPLGEVAQMTFRRGPMFNRTEGAVPTIHVFVEPNTSDIGGYVAKAKKYLADGEAEK